MLTEVGNFRVSSGKLCVSDPCYDQPEVVENVKNGLWTVLSEKLHDELWGTRCTRLVVHHSESDPHTLFYERSKFNVLVDSGQAGIFDASTYDSQNERWYEACCNVTLSKEAVGVIPGGAVSSSGLGDGEYPAYIAKDEDNKIVAIEIVFIDEDFHEDEDYEDFHEEEDEDLDDYE